MTPVYCFDLKLSTKFESIPYSQKFIKKMRYSDSPRRMVLHDIFGGEALELKSVGFQEDADPLEETEMRIYDRGDIRFCLNHDIKSAELKEFDLAESLGDHFYLDSELAHEYIEKQEMEIHILRKKVEDLEAERIKKPTLLDSFGRKFKGIFA